MDVISFSREMSISHADFLRTLSAAEELGPFQIDGDLIQINGSRITIRLLPEGERHIASLRLPQTTVEFRFEGCDAAEVERFMERFQRYFQRGGG